MNISRNRLSEQSQKKSCAYERDEAFAMVYEYFKIPHTIIIAVYKLEQNDLPDSYFFCPYSRQSAEFVTDNNKALSQKSEGRSNSVVLVIFLVWKPRHTGKLAAGARISRFLQQQARNINKSVMTCALSCDSCFNGVFLVSRNLPLLEQHVPYGAGGILHFRARLSTSTSIL